MNRGSAGIFLAIAGLLAGCAQNGAVSGPADAAHPPIEILAADAGRLAAPMELPEAPGRTSTVFQGVEKEAGFNLHSYIAHHDGKFFAIWSSSRVGEEDSDQIVRFATSDDGHTWRAAQVLAADPDGPDGPARWIARGLFVEQGRLFALAAYIQSADYGNRGQGVVWKSLRLMRFMWNGEGWEDRGVFADDCMNNYPPERLGKRWGMACRDDSMNVSMAMADSIENPDWTLTALESGAPFDRMDEPTWYGTADGYVHMIIRDGNGSRRLIRALSNDQGVTWGRPVLTNYPDATSKNFTGRLSDGRYFLINNPNPEGRDPLAISFSDDGWSFGDTLAIRKNAPPRRFAGRAKPSGSFQYPHAIEQGGSLWVIYSTNKEDIEISEFRLERGFPELGR